MLASSVPASFAPTTLAPARASRVESVRMETVGDLEVLSKQLNPTVGFYDPLSLASSGLTETSPFTEAEAIGWLRHAEIKHGRVAMAAFVGFIVQSNGIYFPWNLQGDVTHAAISAAGGPAAQWDALPTSAKLQILGFIGLLEYVGESASPHYMRGGKPGAFGSLKEFAPHPIPLEFWDPFGFTSKMSEERKAKSLLAEINNGRLAMLGIFGFLSASKVPGSVPALADLNIAPYDGEVMAPFSATDSALPFVTEMLKVNALNLF